MSCSNSDTDLFDCDEEFYQTLAKQASEEVFLVTIKGRSNNGELGNYFLTTFKLWMLLSDHDTLSRENSFINAYKRKVELSLPKDFSADIRPYKQCDALDSIFANGREYTINYFFHIPFQKEDKILSESERGCLIEQLNKWCYLVRISDETGFLYIRDLR
jgi:hypothetical protein